MPKEIDYSKSKGFKLDELKQLCKKGRCIISLRREVYDVTSFLEEHPGKSYVLEVCGGEEVDNIITDGNHSKIRFDIILEKYGIKYLGILVNGVATAKNEILNDEIKRRCSGEGVIEYGVVKEHIDISGKSTMSFGFKI